MYVNKFTCPEDVVKKTTNYDYVNVGIHITMEALDLGIVLKAQKSTSKCKSVQSALIQHNRRALLDYLRIELIFCTALEHRRALLHQKIIISVNSTEEHQ